MAQYVVTLTPDADLITATKTYDSILSNLIGDLASSAVWENMDETSGDETYDVKIQHSPDRGVGLEGEVADADAQWYDLVTFAQVTSGATSSEHKDLTTPHYSRLRVVATLNGTSPSAKLTVIVEGVPLGILVT